MVMAQGVKKKFPVGIPRPCVTTTTELGFALKPRIIWYALTQQPTVLSWTILIIATGVKKSEICSYWPMAAS
jgi:hypothetical protein